MLLGSKRRIQLVFSIEISPLASTLRMVLGMVKVNNVRQGFRSTKELCQCITGIIDQPEKVRFYCGNGNSKILKPHVSQFQVGSGFVMSSSL